MKPVGFIVEQKNTHYQKDGTLYEEWELFSHKIYGTQEIAEHAYKQSPYRNIETRLNDEPLCDFNVAGRIIPVYRNNEEFINII